MSLPLILQVASKLFQERREGKKVGTRDEGGRKYQSDRNGGRFDASCHTDWLVRTRFEPLIIIICMCD